MPPNSGVRRSQNNLKTLRNNFKQSISTLHELFPEWTQDDLTFVMDECQGDIDLAITRISEGYANQWDQVKSKKPKPQPQQQKKSFTNKGDGRTLNKQKTNGKAKKTRDKKEKAPIETTPEEEKKPSWASILKGPVKPEEPVNPTCVAIEENVVHVQIEQQDPIPIENKEQEPVKQDIPTKEEEEQEVVAVSQEKDQSETIQVKEELERTVENSNDAAAVAIEEEEEVEEDNDEVDANKNNTTPQPTVKKQTVRRLNQVEAVVLPGNQQPASLDGMNVQFGSLTLNNGEEQEVKDETEVAVVETVIVEPIVEKDPIEKVEEKKETTPVEQPTAPVTNAGLVGLNTNKPLPQPFEPQQQQPLITPQQPQLQQSAPQPQQFQYQHPQIPPQQIHPPQSYPQPYQAHPQQSHIQQPNEAYTINPYTSYVPNMHSNMSGYNLGTPAEYMIYSTEHQRMNYYDHNVYGQSPSLNAATMPHMTRERYNTPPPMEVMMNHTPPMPPPPPQQQQQQQQQQQPYINNGYYSYYYMQPQQQAYSNYQPQSQPQSQQYQQVPTNATGYQQPYVNKTMYQPAYNKTYTSYNDNMLQQTANFDQNNKVYYNQQNSTQSVPQQQQQQQRQPYWHQA